MQSEIEQLNDEILGKYKAAGLCCSRAVDEMIKAIKIGESICELISVGNNCVNKEVSSIYKKVVNKGLCFPVCVSVNNVAGYSCSNAILSEGDLVKIELGVHIDGYPSVMAFSTLVVGEKSDKINDKRANVLNACIDASRKVFQNMKPGVKNTDIVKIMEKCASDNSCALPICNDYSYDHCFLPGVLSPQMSRYVCDGSNDEESELVHRFILSRENQNWDMVELELEKDEIYGVDIVMVSGEASRLYGVNKICVYKRNYENKTMLRMKSSKDALSMFKGNKFPVCVNESDIRVKMGMKECVEKNLVTSYPVIAASEGEFVARIKFTVVVRDQPILICGRSGDAELAKIHI